jgi:hypothetical protein
VFSVRNRLNLCLSVVEKEATDFKGVYYSLGGRDSVVGIATRYGLECPGIESRWVRDFPCCSDLPQGPLSLLYEGHLVFTRGKAVGPWC